jgi:hypothetical protein
VSPVHDAGHDLAVEVGQDRLDRLAALGHRCIESCGDVAGDDVGHDTTLRDSFPVVRHPIRDAMQLRAHLCGVHVAQKSALIRGHAWRAWLLPLTAEW